MQYKLVAIEDIPTSTKNPLDELSVVDMFKICNQMEKLCKENDGIGLSAVQVGLPLDLFVVNRNNYFEYYLNCRYEPSGGKILSIEGCLSLKNESGGLRSFECERYSAVSVKGQRLNFHNNIFVEDFTSSEIGLYSIVFQHEIDHSLGVFIKDIGKEIYLS